MSEDIELQNLAEPEKVNEIINDNTNVKSLWIIIGIFSAFIILISILYFVSGWPYNIYYIPKDPRNGKKIPIEKNEKGQDIYSTQAWLMRNFDYAPSYITEPDLDVRCSYYYLVEQYCYENPNQEVCLDQNLPRPLQKNGEVPLIGCDDVF